MGINRICSFSCGLLVERDRSAASASILILRRTQVPFILIEDCNAALHSGIGHIQLPVEVGLAILFGICIRIGGGVPDDGALVDLSRHCGCRFQVNLTLCHNSCRIVRFSVGTTSGQRQNADDCQEQCNISFHLRMTSFRNRCIKA